ncbi:F-box domain protein [Aspergillus luchuensis]|uniref:F-box domain protein n=1 Tax=Aspergillus kawachii TaxID=1069201 RepID=A0A146F428_ASPKA|nr:F-box domain protein [Aspergillus luchuensis]
MAYHRATLTWSITEYEVQVWGQMGRKIAVHLAEKLADGHVARRRPPATSTSGMARKAPKRSKE